MIDRVELRRKDGTVLGLWLLRPGEYVIFKPEYIDQMAWRGNAALEDLEWHREPDVPQRSETA